MKVVNKPLRKKDAMQLVTGQPVYMDDVIPERLLGTAAAYTTVQTDVNDGLEEALSKLREKTGPLEFEARYACSSAAGGLRMITSG